jgi:cobalt/nickel transport system permease protein
MYRHGASPLHRLPAQVAITTTFGFVVAVVLTPREAMWAFGLYASMAIAALVLARLPPGFVGARLLVLVPFLLAAASLPLLEGPPDAFWGLSREGLWDAWNIAAKGVLGATASVVLAATHEPPDLVTGLERLRVPRVVTAIMGFMVRYLELVVGEVARMRVAMRSRGHHARGVAGVAPMGRALGSLFIRVYERGERVYLAMASRGYHGTMPASGAVAPMASWAAGAGVVVLAAAVAAIAAVTT